MSQTNDSSPTGSAAGYVGSLFSGLKDYFFVSRQDSVSESNIPTVQLIKNLITGEEEMVMNATKEPENESQLLTKSYQSVLFVLIVIQHEDKFCTTEEVDGWHLPAGRVLYGETIGPAAKRIAFEEAGLDIEITGILRFEYNYREDILRFRCVVSAVTKNPEEIKQFQEENPDEFDFDNGNSIAAHWYTLHDVLYLTKKKANSKMKLHRILAPVDYSNMSVNEGLDVASLGNSVVRKRKKISFLARPGGAHSVNSDVSKSRYTRNSKISRSMKAKRVMRNNDMAAIFKLFSSPSLSLVQPDIFFGLEGGQTTDKMTPQLFFTARLVIRTRTTNKYLILHKDASQNGSLSPHIHHYIALPEDNMKVVIPFYDLANDLLLDYMSLLNLKKPKKKPRGKKKKNAPVEVPFAELVGICGVKHIPPNKISLKSRGSLCFTYLAHIDDSAEKVIVKKRWKWLSQQELLYSYNKMKSKATPKEIRMCLESLDILDHCQEGLIGPLTFLVEEGADYSVSS